MRSLIFSRCGLVKVPDLQAHRDKQLAQCSRRRRFPICAGYVDDGLGVLRVAHEMGQAPHPLGVRGLEAPVRQNSLEILVAVEPRQCLT